MTEQHKKGLRVMNHLQCIGLNMLTIGHAIEDKNLEKSYQLLKLNPKINKEQFLKEIGIEEIED